MMYDFTTNKYAEFLNALVKVNFPIYTIVEWIKKNPSEGLILRHDVDRKPKQAIKIAKIAAECGAIGTFNFRVLRDRTDKNAVVDISNMGHEIGYHYEDLSIAKGDVDTAIEYFEKNLKLLREIADVKTATMHGRPLSKYDNRDIWKFTSVERFNLYGEAYKSIDYKNIYYLTDTGRTWGETNANLRDSAIDAIKTPKHLRSTDDVKEFISSNPNISVAIVFHPERWSSNYLQLFFQFLIDLSASTIKRIIKLITEKY